MNKEDRKAVERIVGELNSLKDEIEELRSQEQDKFDNMSEGLQAGDTGQAIEAAATALENAHSAIDEAVGELEGI